MHEAIRPEMFTIETLVPRVREVGDLWAPLREHAGADLLGALEKLR